MEASEAHRAISAARSVAAALGMPAEQVIVLNDSNRLVVRLMPCNVVARVTPPGSLAPAAVRATWSSGGAYGARLAAEIEVVRQLAQQGAPAAGLDPRIEPRLFMFDWFAVTLWEYIEPAPLTPASSEYAAALERLHAGLRMVDAAAPHFLERVAATERDVASHTITPDLSEPDRAFLAQTLRQFRERVAKRGAPEQLLHGEPHPDNLLSTRETTLFIDFEDVIRGPVEFDLAWVPQDVAELYADADQELVDLCRGIVLAIIATHRWCENDHHPSGRESGVAFLEAVREDPPWRSLDTVQFRRG